MENLSKKLFLNISLNIYNKSPMSIEVMNFSKFEQCQLKIDLGFLKKILYHVNEFELIQNPSINYRHLLNVRKQIT